MNSCGERFLGIWMVMSVLIGVAGGYLRYRGNHNFDEAGSYGLRYFLLAYIIGWVIYRVARFAERTGPSSEDDDTPS